MKNCCGNGNGNTDEYSSQNQTWTARSSAVQGTWNPYPNDPSFESWDIFNDHSDDGCNGKIKDAAGNCLYGHSLENNGTAC
jgi:hypothetical protein